MRFGRLAFSLALAAALPAHAERATERFAPTQLSVAQEFLERAQAEAIAAQAALIRNAAK